MRPVRVPVVAHRSILPCSGFCINIFQEIAEQSGRQWLSWLLLEVGPHLIPHHRQLMVRRTLDLQIALGLVGQVSTF